MIEKCFSELYKTKLPEEKEWRKEIIYGAGFEDAVYYFRGYYTLEETAGGYKFTVCEQYAD